MKLLVVLVFWFYRKRGSLFCIHSVQFFCLLFVASDTVLFEFSFYMSLIFGAPLGTVFSSCRLFYGVRFAQHFIHLQYIHRKWSVLVDVSYYASALLFTDIWEAYRFNQLIAHSEDHSASAKHLMNGMLYAHVVLSILF